MKQTKQRRPRYYSLNKGSESLMAQVGYVLPPGAVIAQVEYALYSDGPKIGKPKYCFEYFSGFNEFLDHYKTVPVEKRHYYEMILSEARRKPYFDIDAEVPLSESKQRLEERQLFLEKLLDAIDAVFVTAGATFNVRDDVVVIDSSGPKKGAFKISLHIIITNWYLRDADESLEFYRRTMLAFDTASHPHWVDWIDDGVYSRGRCFRVLGSCKIGSRRNLTIMPHWLYRGETIRSSLLGDKNTARRLYASMITTTANARAFPKMEIAVKKKVYEVKEASDDETNAALALFKDYIIENSGLVGKSIFAAFPFEKRSVSGTLISFNRISPSYCALCSEKEGKPRHHESDTPYVTICRDAVYFNCHRGDRKGYGSVYLGSLGSDETSDEEESSSETEDAEAAEDVDLGQAEVQKGDATITPAQEGRVKDTSNITESADSSYRSEDGKIMEKPSYTSNIFSELDQSNNIASLFKRKVVI